MISSSSICGLSVKKFVDRTRETTNGEGFLEIEDPKRGEPACGVLLGRELTDPARIPWRLLSICTHWAVNSKTHISKVSVQHLDVSVDDLQRDQLVISRTNPANEEQGRISPVDDLGV